jgi:hypothetical protein
MRTTLRISIGLNCSLLGCLAFLMLHARPARHESETSAATHTLPPDTEPLAPAPEISPSTEVKPFHWSQIQSADYDTYIANLRGIGCPEQTIHDIVAADVDSLYLSRRRPLEQGLAASSFAGRLAVERELRELRNEESAAVSALLLAQPAAANTTPALAAEAPSTGSALLETPTAISTPQNVQNLDPSAQELNRTALDVLTESPPSRPVRQELRTSVPPPQGLQNFAPSTSELRRPGSEVAAAAPPLRSVRQEPQAPISLPLAFHEVDSSVLLLNSQQAQAVSDLRQTFIEAVGGPNQDPSDPAYSQRWQTSQPAVDLDLCGMLGINAFQAYQIAAWAKANEPALSGP